MIAKNRTILQEILDEAWSFTSQALVLIGVFATILLLATKPILGLATGAILTAFILLTTKGGENQYGKTH